jgi:phosphoglycerate-specific signal transduction histidine kinase
MSSMAVQALPQLRILPRTLPLDNAVRIELEEGVPVFHASSAVQARIETLLDKQRSSRLSTNEDQELDLYEEVDDYLSFVNRAIRNLLQSESNQAA